MSVLETHLRLRGVQRGLYDELVHALPPKAVEEAAKRLDMWEKNGLATDDEDELGVVVDVALYDCFQNGTNAVERYRAARKLSPETDRGAVLDAMCAARFTLLALGAVEPGVGVHVDDLLWGDKFLLCDVALANETEREAVIATRVVPRPDFSVTTGVALGFDPEIAALFATTFAETNSSDVPPAQWPSEKRAGVATMLLRLALLDPAEARTLLSAP